MQSGCQVAHIHPPWRLTRGAERTVYVKFEPRRVMAAIVSNTVSKATIPTIKLISRIL